MSEKMPTKKEVFDKVVAELNLNTDDPYTLLFANALAIADQRDALAAKLAEVEAEKGKWEWRCNENMKALMSMTPGGSEYHNNPEACVAYIRAARDSQHSAIVKFKQAANKAESAAYERAAKVCEEKASMLKLEQCTPEGIWYSSVHFNRYTDLTILARAIRALGGVDG